MTTQLQPNEPLSALLNAAAEVIDFEKMSENDRLVAALRAAAERERWIPVSERLPDRFQLVLVANDRKSYLGCGAYAGNRWLSTQLWLHETPVTHWRPLPAPPAV